MKESGALLLEQAFGVLGIKEVDEASVSNLESVFALNTLSWPRTELIEISDSEAIVASGEGHKLAVDAFRPVSDGQKDVTVQKIAAGVFQLENSQLTVKVEGGCITSVYDRQAKREVLSGKANQYVIFDDKPVYWQAWDAEVYHLDTREELCSSSTTIHEDKGYRASLVTETRISETSSIKTIISLTASINEQPSFIEFTADVDWHETMKFLKVEFPVQVRNTEASYETQYGIIKRPTHYNTS